MKTLLNIEVLKMNVFGGVEEKMSKIEKKNARNGKIEKIRIKWQKWQKLRKFAYSEEKRILLRIYKM